MEVLIPTIAGAFGYEVIGGVTFYAASGAIIGSVSYATLIGYAVTIGASIAYSSAQNARLRNAAKGLGDQGRNVMIRDPIAPQRIVYGQVLLGGSVSFLHTTGTKNEFLHVVVEQAGHEVEEIGTVYFVGSDGLETITLDGSGNATGKYAGYFLIKKHLGTPGQAADATLVAAAASKWTSNHRLRGCAYFYAQFTYSPDLYPNGMPTVLTLVKGKKLLDPRVGIVTPDCATTAGNAHIVASTAGLSAGMRVIGPGMVEGTRIVSLDVSTTFFTVDVPPQLSIASVRLACGTDAWSANAALCSADYLTNFKFGRRVLWYNVDQTGLQAEANVCEESIVLADASTENRYDCNGTATADQDAMAEILTSMAGRVTTAGAKYTILAGAYRAPTAPTFVDDDLVGPFQLQPRQSMKDSYSGVKGTYVSVTNQWQPADFPLVKNDTYAGQDGGRRRFKDVTYSFTTSPATSQRLAKSDLERGRQQQVFQGVYKLKAFQLQCGDTIKITRAVLGWTDKIFEVLNWSLRIIQNGENNIVPAIAITAQETAAAVWDWADGEETAVDLAPNTDLPNPSVVATPTGLALLTDSSTSIIQGDGTFVPRLKLTWNLPADTYVTEGGRTYIEYKLHADSIWLDWSNVAGSKNLEFITDVKVGLVYDVRIYFRNAIGVASNSSGVRTYNTVSSYTIAADTSTPATPTGLTATAGTGKSIGLTWTANTEPDLLGYKIYRNTVNNAGTATLIAILAAKFVMAAFVDVNVSLGQTYYYFITAVDETNNESAKSSGASATPTGVATGGTVSNPTAATQTGSGVYTVSDGTVYAYEEFSLPALPAGAVGQDLLYKKSADSTYIVAGSFYNTGTLTGLRVPELSPGVAFTFATQAWNSFGDVSSIVAASGSPFTTPVKTAGPADPTGGALTSTGVVPRANPAAGTPLQYFFGCHVYWNPNTEADFDHYEIKATTTDSDGATDYSWYSPGGTAAGILLTTPDCMLYNFTLGAGYVRIRAFNTSGVASNWVALGNANGSASTGLGTAAGYGVGTSGSTVAVGNDTRITGAAQKSSNLSDLGSASSARGNLGLGTAAVKNVNAMGDTVHDNIDLEGSVGNAKGLSFDGSNRIAFYWDGSNVKVVVDGSGQGTIPNP